MNKIDFKPQDINFRGQTAGNDGIVSKQVEHEFDTKVISAEVVIKAFSLIHKLRDNHFDAGGAEIINVAIDGDKVQCTARLRLVDNNQNTLDPEQVTMSIVYLVECE